MKKYISALLDKYRSAILIAVMLCFAFVGNSQVYQQFNQYGATWKRQHITTVFGIPNDTFAIDAEHQAYPHVAFKSDSLYLWNVGLLRWTLLSSTGNSFASCEDKLIDGGHITYSGTGLKFYISPAIYRINCVIYTTTYDSVTLTTADPTDPRKDVIYLATTGVEVLTGTPAGPAAEPQLDANQIKLTVVDVPAGSTVPSITTNVVYDDNLGESVVTNVGTTTDPDNTSNVYKGTKSLNVTNIIQYNQVIFTLTSSVDLTIFDGISMFLRLKAIMASNSQLWIQFYNGSVAASNEIPISFNHTSLTYQGLTIPMTSFNLTGAFADKVRIRYHQFTGTTHPGFYLDYVHFESGVPQPGGGDQLVMGSFGTQTSSPDGAVIAAGKLHMQPVTTAHYGLMSPAQKAKLDSLRSDYFIDNVGDGEELATQVDDSTVGIKSLKAGTGVTLDVTDTTVTINSGGSQTWQQTLTAGSNLTGNNTINGGGFNFHFNNHRQFNISTASVTSDTVTTFEFNPAIGQGSIAISDLTNTTSWIFRPESLQLNSPLISLSTDNLYFNGTLPQSVAADDSMLVWNPTSKQVSMKAVSGGGGGSYTDADARAAISLTTTGSSGAATYNSGTGVFNIPDYSSGTSIWNGTVIGTSFSATSTTISSAALQWTFTGSSPATFTLPARTSSVNQFYTIKNIGSADLTVAADGTDDIYTTSSVASVTVVPGGSIMITGAASGTSDLWTALFHTGSSSVPSLTQYRLAVGDASNLLSTNSAITGNRALASDANGVPVASTTTDTELGYVNGVTSAIQTQLNTKATGSITQNWFDDDLTINGVTTKINRADFFDDMLTSPNSTAGTSYMLEVPSGTGADASIGNTGTTPPDGRGWAAMSTGTTTTGSAALGSTSVSLAKNIVDTTKAYRFETRLQIETLSDDTEDFRFVCGLVSSSTNTTATNQIWFRYNDNTNSGNWTCYSADGTTTESTSSGVAAAAGSAVILAFEFDNAAIKFYVNGSLIATHTTRIPLHAASTIFPVLSVTKTLGSTNRNVFIDYVKYRRL